jgi:cellobiose-specific phosphotransferase system component IIA
MSDLEIMLAMVRLREALESARQGDVARAVALMAEAETILQEALDDR